MSELQCQEFDRLWTQDLRADPPSADYEKAEREFVRVAAEFYQQHPNMGAMVLECTGFRFHHKEALEMLKKAGAFISEGNLVKFPARLVKDALASAPGRIMMCDRDGARQVADDGRVRAARGSLAGAADGRSRARDDGRRPQSNPRHRAP